MEKENFDSFWRELHPQLRRIAHFIVNGRAWTRKTTEVLHDTYIKRLQAGSSLRFESKQHFLAEMSRVLAGEVADAYRNRITLKRDVRQTTDLEHAAHAAIDPRIEPSVDAARAISLLGKENPGDLNLVIEFCLGGLTHSELASLYGISEPAVRKRLSRARERARLVLERAGHSPSG